MKDLNVSILDNLILNMSGGLLPEQLSESEIQLLVDEYGKDWFDYLGYKEPFYKRPN